MVAYILFLPWAHLVFRTILCGWARVLSGLETSTQEAPVNAYGFRKDMDVFLILQLMPQVFAGALVSSGFHPLMLISGNNCLCCLSDSLLCLSFIIQATSDSLALFSPFIFNDSMHKTWKKEKSKKRSPPRYYNKGYLLILFYIKFLTLFQIFRKVFKNRTKNSWIPFTWLPNY